MFRTVFVPALLLAIGCAAMSPAERLRAEMANPNRVELCVKDDTAGNNGVKVYVDGFRRFTVQHGQTDCKWISVQSGGGTVLTGETMGGGLMGPTVYYPMTVNASLKCWLWTLGEHASSSAALTPCWHRR